MRGNRWTSSAAAIAAQGFDPAGQISGGPQAAASRVRATSRPPDHHQHAFQRALSLQRFQAPGAVVAFGLSPAQWLDYIAPGQKVPNDESSMWGDYHLRELALMLLREARGESYLTFFDYTGRK